MNLPDPTWFEITARANFEKHLLPHADKEPRCLQIGAFTGDASVWILENLPRAHLTDVDTWRGSEEHEGYDWDEIRHLHYQRTHEHYRAGRLETFVGTSSEFFDSWGTLHPWHAGGAFDFVYIDGDHRAPTVLCDAVDAFRRLLPGGIMAFDDYTWESERGILHAPFLAIETFARIFGEELERIEMNSQLWLRRRLVSESTD